MLNDQKERIQLVAMESLAAFAAFADKFSIMEIVHKIVTTDKLSPYLIDRI